MSKLKIKNYLGLLIFVIFLWGCATSTKHILRKKTKAYFKAWNRHDFTNSDFANFKMDTCYVWHNNKKGKGQQNVFDPNSGWKQWDIAWNGTYQFEITNIDTGSLKVTGKFIETTDFLKIIGMPTGYSATVTYWFNKDLKVKEILYDWDEKNRNMHEVIKPIVIWAKEHDSLRIQKIYLRDGFVPNKENAKEWKELLMLWKYRKIAPVDKKLRKNNLINNNDEKCFNTISRWFRNL